MLQNKKSLDTHSMTNSRGNRKSLISSPDLLPRPMSLQGYINLTQGSSYLASASGRRRRQTFPPVGAGRILPSLVFCHGACIPCSPSAQQSTVVLIASLWVFISSTGQLVSEGPHPLWKQNNVKSSVISCAVTHTPSGTARNWNIFSRAQSS